MSDSTFGPLRLYDASSELSFTGLPPPYGGQALERTELSLLTLSRELAACETLRPSYTPRETLEPLSLPWYLELEQVRHHRQGRWLPKLLEFGKHQGEKLLGLGDGLGSDLVRYAQAGAEVTVVSSHLEQLSLIRRNFELRGLFGSFVHASPTNMPLESSSIDVVCLLGLLHDVDDPSALIDEVYRVLKPGGKLLTVVPAHFDIHYWSRLFLLGRTREECCPRSSDMLHSPRRRFTSRSLRHLLSKFPDCRVWKRHLRRAEVPHLWRWIPLSLLERLGGRLLVFKGFKPVSAARMEQLAA